MEIRLARAATLADCYHPNLRDWANSEYAATYLSTVLEHYRLLKMI